MKNCSCIQNSWTKMYSALEHKLHQPLWILVAWELKELNIFSALFTVFLPHCGLFF